MTALTAALKEEIMAYAAERLAKYAQPTQIYVVEDFPRNATGKLLRRQLVDRIAQLSQEEGKTK